MKIGQHIPVELKNRPPLKASITLQDVHPGIGLEQGEILMEAVILDEATKKKFKK